ncbi:MAG TPA: septum formation initiator family protein [Mariprofundaceae bacterium]|nr:septum formation initiator family protein [Mariprofundaceae bacterium]
MVVYLGYDLVFSDHGYLVYRREHAELLRLQTEVAEMRQQRERLARQVLQLRNDPKALEELIHRELGYVHPDEYMLILPDKKKPKPQARP